MGMMINRRRVMGGKSHKININVKTHSTGSVDASLDVITGSGEPVNIFHRDVLTTPWTNEYIQVEYKASPSYSWSIFAITPCLYNGQVYKSGDLIATWRFSVTNNITIVASGKKGLPAGAIDMGLPSGTLWAQGNIIKDANGNYAIGEPTDYGCYFSWGNIDGHNEGDGYSFSDNNYALTPGSQLTGDIPSDDAEHDAAVARIGGGFHLPSGDQMTELFNTEYTTNEWTTVNGVNGRRVTSLINGNSIFFPAAGYYDGTTLNFRDSRGLYWSSRRYSSSGAYCLYFYSGNTIPQSYYYRRNLGFSVRAVFNG